MPTWMPLELVRKVDHLLLEPQLSRQEIEAGCQVAMRLDCYAVVVKPHYIELARKALKDTPVKIISVVGFPHGGVTTATKMFETQDVLQRGADEVALVVNIGALRDGDDLVVKNDILSVVKVARGHPITVILETGLLSDEEKTRGCKIAQVAGAAFVQTGTDFAPASVTVGDIRLLRAASPDAKVIAAGGIARRHTAQQMIEAGAVRIATRFTEKIAAEA
jgi:deoxyribose-phosphate aldolase